MLKHKAKWCLIKSQEYIEQANAISRALLLRMGIKMINRRYFILARKRKCTHPHNSVTYITVAVTHLIELS
jgi:hypothetical protein